MPESRPAQGSKAIQVVLRYDVDPAWIQQQIIETGMEPGSRWVINIDLRELETPELRQLVLQAQQVYKAAPGYPMLPEPTEDAAVIARAVLDQLVAEEAEGANETAAFEADRRAWIEAHGSQRLKLAFSRGYTVNKLYLVERVRADFPGFWVDTSSDAEWNERANPTAAALNIETAVDARLLAYDGYASDLTGSIIVWLTEFPPDMQDHVEELDDYDDQVEAILVSSWLGRHDIYLPVDPALRSPADDSAWGDE